MTLLPGTRLGPYEILSAIGAGGMGEVYRARDVNLDREVAVKVLPAATAGDPERLARFEREARVLAALNHPQIAHVYGVEHSGETRAIVMELVSGSTLAVPQPFDTALCYARQIAEALEAAHEKGITHRDLKPGNIMVTAEGAVKVLDFGLASAPGSETAGSPLSSPTITMAAAATQAGVILGTAAYMSPEQAAGKPVDKRSDIWSFGVVLYEMLTGSRLFEGETISHTLAHVLTRPIDLGQLDRDTPADIVSLIGRCLVRDPRNRLRDIGEARIAIDRYLSAPGPAKAPFAATPRGGIRAWAPWLVAAGALAAAGTLAWKQFGYAPAAGVVRFEVPTPPKTFFGAADTMAFSPDGRYLAFTSSAGIGASASQLWLRPVDSTEAHALAGTSGAHFPFWSPDTRYLAFSTPEGLKKLSLEGGPPVSLTKARPIGGSWGRNGVILIGSASGPLLQVPEGGGDTIAPLPLDNTRQETSQFWPQFLPDGRSFLYLSRSAKETALYLGTLGSTATRRIVESPGHGVYSGGFLLYPRAQALVAQPFDPSSGKFTGAFFPVADRVGATMFELAGTTFSASSSGALAFRPQIDTLSQISIFNRSGGRLGAAGPPGDYAQITFTPDGKQLAIDRRENGQYDIWMLQLANGVFSRVTFDPANDRDPVFCPDGRQMVYTNSRSGSPHLYRKTIGGGPEELIYSGPDREASEAWLKDGSILFGNSGGRKYFLLLPGQAVPKLLYQSDYQVDEPAVSPDGKWVAYGSSESGRWETYVARFPEWDERRQISTDGGMQPHWRHDGREIVYMTPDGNLMSVNVKPGSPFEAAAPSQLFATGQHPSGTVEQWTMSQDASRFYVLTAVQAIDRPITVVLNWTAGARR
jgi:Tol biopolymer transport system component